MITGNIKDCEKYYSIHKNFEKAFDFLKTLSEESELGKRILEENNLTVNVAEYETVPGAPRQFEAHKDFIDIHYVIKGSETFGYSNLSKLEVTKEYDEAGDYLLLDGAADELELSEGDFCVVFPEDAHIPFIKKCCEGTLKRATAKVRL